MIPLRLMLENFMCYREKTEISFRGSTIWALSGHNGSGKSTIFDAMRYALYGEHRAGKQKTEALIHRSATPASSFMIEFDFAVGANEYRIQRTYLQKKKKGTMQVLHLNGPDAPIPGRPGPQFIPGTESREGFESWVSKTIGLDERAFTVSVLLLQGQSDKLLKLSGPDRHDVLAHIIDLSRYDALAKKAQDKQKEQDAFAKTYKGQLDSLERFDEASIGSVEEQAREAQIKKGQARQRQLALTTLKEQARNWQQLQEEEKQLLQELKRFECLLAQSTEIERNADRLANLQQVIQPLIQIQQKQAESGCLQLAIERDREQATELGANVQRVYHERQKIQQQLEATRACHQQHDQEYKAVQAELLALQVPCNDVARLHEKQQVYRELLENLSIFAPDLEYQQLQLRDNLNELDSIKITVPLLQRFADFRSEWQQATQELDGISQELHQHKIEQEQVITYLQELQETREMLREQIGKLQNEVTSQSTLLDKCQERLDRFHTVEGGATCDYCGQPLTKEHLDTERQRIEEELQEREHHLQLWTTSLNTMLQRQKEVEQDILQAKRKEQQQLQAHNTLTNRQNTIVRARDLAYIEAKNRLEQLTPEYLKHVQGTTEFVDVHTCLQATYPTPQDLEVLSLPLRNRPDLDQKLQAVAKALTEHQEICQKQEYILNEIKPLTDIYPPERAKAILEEQEQKQQRAGVLTKTLEELSPEIEQQEQHHLQLAKQEQEAKEEQSRLEQSLAIARTNLQHAQQSIAEAQKRIPDEWQIHISHLSPQMVAGWQQEIKDLEGATERRQELIEARQRQSQHQQALAVLEIKQSRIPEEAQCLPEQVQEEIDLVDTSYQAFEKQEQESRAEAQRLQSVRQRYQELQQQWAEAARLASRYKELTHLLGREGLQHHLLQNAEAGIIYYANDMLDRISGGTLRLELDRSAASRTRTKALDMVAYNSSISVSKSQAIELLSGSQQFRVAISLAIGIGQYMGNASHRIESIMIDEGFGSLDAASRDEMTQALQALVDDFKCVIVVSHQNEFSDKFPNRYEAVLVDGRTKIALA